MRKKLLTIIITVTMFMTMILGCNQEKENTNYGEPVNSDFKGIGFEWDMYDSMDNWSSEIYTYLKGCADDFKPSTIRVMFDIDKYCVSFSDNLMPIYDFETESMKNVYDILQYCQDNDVNVAIGLWHARHEGSYVNDAIHDEGNTLFAKVAVDMLAHIINIKKYSCVKYLVPYNEPNYTRRRRNNVLIDSYTLWSECMNNLIDEMSKRVFLSEVLIAAPDVSSMNDSAKWIEDSVKDFDNNIGVYQLHTYTSDYLVSTGGYRDRLNRAVSKANDTGKQFWIYESGISDGIVSGQGQTKIKTYDYVLGMTDMTIQAVLAGVDGMLYWALDSKMHQVNGVDSDFGMINSQTKELRPWYYSSTLISRCLPKGCKIFQGEDYKNVRSIYSINDKQTYAIGVNREDEAKSIKFQINSDTDAIKVYIYLLNEQDVFLNDNKQIIPSLILDKSFKDGIELTVPKQSSVIISTEQFF